MQIQKLKKNIKFGRMIKSALFKVCSIPCYTFFHFFFGIYEYHANKNLPLLPRTIHRAIFISSYKLKHRSAVRDPSMQTSGNWKEPSLISKPHGGKTSQLFFQRAATDFAICDGVLLSRKTTLCCLFRYSGLFSSYKLFKLVNVVGNV